MKKTNCRIVFLTIWVLCQLIPVKANAATEVIIDTCGLHDACETAIELPMLVSDEDFYHLETCNRGASPAAIDNSCLLGNRPTTWFKVTTDEYATVMNIGVSADDFTAPTISVFHASTDCQGLVPISLTSAGFDCILGSRYNAEAIGTPILPNSTYYVVVGSATGQTGNFHLFINTVAFSSECVKNRDIEIWWRSSGQPLEKPYEPGETVSVCFNINSFSAKVSACEWFQGLIPVFGNGWDPASFTSEGQPKNVTLNGWPLEFGDNGLYGNTTWDWFAGVDYHFDEPDLQVFDGDNNGRLDLFHSRYEPFAYGSEGLKGGCCLPCWQDSSGTILPPGWFAHGNLFCFQPGTYVRSSFGDGDGCGEGMGPWNFCFDLVVRDFPDCLFEYTNDELSLGFFTFSDGQVGHGLTSQSICAYDQPAKITLPMNCRSMEPFQLANEALSGICTGDSIQFTIAYPGIDHWTWTIWPENYIQQPVYAADNGHLLIHEVINQTGSPVLITIRFSGEDNNSDSIVHKNVFITIYPDISVALPEDLRLCELDTSTHLIYPELTGGTGNYEYHWQPFTTTTLPTLPIRLPFPKEVILEVNDEINCYGADTMYISTRPCHLIDNESPTEVSNDPDTLKDSPPPVMPFADQGKIISRTVVANQLSVTPVPAHDQVVISFQQQPTTGDILHILDVNGRIVQTVHEEHPLHSGMRVNIEGLSPGVFHVHYNSGNSISTARMVKM